ncbi:hypothetical protein EJB05_53458 [Eragrostis curvula]|uniref:Uncharacterized protein n=1 Tax=Eragrostis curvula TaxID=38414 RepID=A0A5J9SQ44_9POAL|nr:hypothetical protein EJB05_53458 [Eragrostis curvula]
MAVKSIILFGVVLASVLLIFLDVAYARELSDANGSVGRNVEPATRSPGLNDEKWFIIGAGGRDGQPNYGAGYSGGYLPGYGPGYGPLYGGRYGSPGYPGVYGYPGYVSGRIGPYLATRVRMQAMWAPKWVRRRPLEGGGPIVAAAATVPDRGRCGYAGAEGALAIGSPHPSAARVVATAAGSRYCSSGRVSISSAQGADRERPESGFLG